LEAAVAARSASYKFPDLSTFLKVYEESISKNSLLFKGGDIDSDVAQTFKLDLIIPVLGRQGPFEAQVLEFTFQTSLPALNKHFGSCFTLLVKSEIT
jgi:hypothetical protein